MALKLVLAIQVVLISCVSLLVCGQRCRTIPTSGGTPRSEPCVFPFFHKGRRYTGCTRDNDPQKRFWCSVEVDSKGQHVGSKGRWGHCGRGCLATVGGRTTTKRPLLSTARVPVRQTTKRPPVHPVTRPTSNSAVISRPAPTSTPRKKDLECVTVSGPSPNKNCIFPVIYDGATYTKCIEDVQSPSLTWCSTKVDSLGRHVQGHWGHCFCTSKAGCLDVHFNELIKATPKGTYLPKKHDADFRCGVARLHNEKVQFIIGGVATKLQEFPFAVLLGYETPKQTQNLDLVFLCSGALINRRYVLTAAHCVQSTPKKVRLGDYDITKDCDCLDGKCAPVTQTIDVEEVIRHENYNPRTFVYDVALIRMAKPAILNAGVGVVCMPDESLNRNLVDETATVMGWGRNLFFSNGRLLEIGAPVSIIQKVEVPIIDTETCKTQYNSNDIGENNICAGKKGSDSCKGDSGGPLVYRSGPAEPWTLIGIVSFGDVRCGGGKAGVYSDVRQFMDWIRYNLKD